MSRFIFTRLAQLLVLSAALLSTTTRTDAGVAGCLGTCCNTYSGPTCCANNYMCCSSGGGWCCPAQ
jgi:hypothetical protein